MDNFFDNFMPTWEIIIALKEQGVGGVTLV